MDNLRGLLRGAVAALAAFLVMGVLAVAALAWLGTPVNWSLVATVLAASVGGSVSLTSSLDPGAVTVALQGSADVVPLGVCGPGALVFGAAIYTSSVRAAVLRALGAAGTVGILLVVVVSAGDATVRIPLPVGDLPIGRNAQLVLRPDVGSTVVCALLGLVALIGGCALLARLPYRRAAATVAIVGSAVLILVGPAVAVVVAAQRPAFAGAAMLFGANAVVLLMLGAGSRTVLDGALASALREGALAPAVSDAAGRGGWLLGGTVPTVVAFGVVVLVCAGALAFVPPDPVRRWHPAHRGRWQRAGVRALVAGTVLALVLVAASVVGAGSLDLGVSVLVFNVRLLALHVPSAVGWALLAGAVCGGVAGLVGSLLADARWARRSARRLRTTRQHAVAVRREQAG